MEKIAIMIKTAMLALFTPITRPGKYDLQVFNNVSEKNLVADEDGRNPRYIVTLKAVAADKLAQLKAVFTGKDEVPIEDTNGLFMTANIWKREGEDTILPMKGETVEVAVDFVESRENEQVLRVVNIRVKPAVKAGTFDLAEFFAATEEEKTQVASPENTLVHS